MQGSTSVSLRPLTSVLPPGPRMPGLLGLLGWMRRPTQSFDELFRRYGDVYTLKLIIHDWDDERAAAILRTCRRAMGDHGTLLILDAVVPPGVAGTSAEFVQALRRDVNMMAWTGGLERTAEEFGELLAAAGFRLARDA